MTVYMYPLPKVLKTTLYFIFNDDVLFSDQIATIQQYTMAFVMCEQYRFADINYPSAFLAR